jgi:hypothetical protein
VNGHLPPTFDTNEKLNDHHASIEENGSQWHPLDGSQGQLLDVGELNDGLSEQRRGLLLQPLMMGEGHCLCENYFILSELQGILREVTQ